MELTSKQKTARKKMWKQAHIVYLATPVITVEELQHLTGLPKEELQLKIFGKDGKGGDHLSWFYVKSHITDAAMVSVMADQRAVVENTGKIALNIIATSLRRINDKLAQDDDYIVEIDDLAKIAGIFEKMDKLVRLDNGQATEIVQSMKLSYEQKVNISKVLGNDPFIVDVPFSEVVSADS